MNNNVTIGIDLGTSKTCWSRFNQRANNSYIGTIRGKEFEDTVLVLDDKNEVVIWGTLAWNQLPNYPNAIMNFKPEIGPDNEKENNAAVKWLGIIKKAIEKEFNNQEIDEFNVVFGYPSGWDISKKRKLLECAKKSGFQNVCAIDEPVAALLHWKHNEKIKETLSGNANEFNVLIFDFGGGTLDLTLLKIDEYKNIKIIATGGDPELGGRNFDKRIYNFLVNKYYNGKVSSNYDMSLLWKLSRELKQELSNSIISDGKHEYSKKEMTDEKGFVTFVITKDDFEKICKDLIDRSVNLIIDFFNGINFPVEKVSEVITVGGSSYLYFVNQNLKKLFVSMNSKDKDFIIINKQPVIANGLSLYLDDLNDALASKEEKIKGKISDEIKGLEKIFSSLNFDQLIESKVEAELDGCFEAIQLEVDKKIKEIISEYNLNLNNIIHSASKYIENSYGKINYLINFNLIEHFETSIDSSTIHKILETNVIEDVALIVLNKMPFNLDKIFRKKTIKDSYKAFFSFQKPTNKSEGWQKHGGYLKMVFDQVISDIEKKVWERFKKIFKSGISLED